MNEKELQEITDRALQVGYGVKSQLIRDEKMRDDICALIAEVRRLRGIVNAMDSLDAVEDDPAFQALCNRLASAELHDKR